MPRGPEGHGLSGPLETWPDQLAAMAPEQAREAAAHLFQAWIKGELRTSPFQGGPISLTEADRRLGRFFAGLPDSIEEVLELEHMETTEDAARRWCWAPGWYLISQDEDLLLMDDALVVPLLEEAAADCYKRDYALSIVEHHIRDGVHHALWDGASSLPGWLRKVGQWAGPAREARAPALARYIERMAGYGEVRAVDAGEMAQRVLDLRRCHPNEAVAPQVRSDGEHWVARLDRANITPGELWVERATGRMRAV